MVSVPFQHRPLQRLASGHFRSALGRGHDWHKAMVDCLDQLGEVGQANLGIVYIDQSLSAQAGPITAGLRTATGINDWVGTTSNGLIGGKETIPSDAGLSLMVGRFAKDSVRLFGKGTRGRTAWVRRHRPSVALVHGAAGQGDTAASLSRLHKATTAELIGGLSGGPGTSVQIGERLSEEGLSGVLFAESVSSLSGLSQGCMPISPAREVTKARGQFVFAIDGQPALQVLKRDIGEVLARDLRRAEGYIFAGLLSGQTDKAYAVRRIVATDEKSGAVVLSEAVKAGQHILFARRDKEGALDELRRMLHQMEAKLGGRVPQGAIYVACHQRVAALFGSADTELAEIRRVFGDVPLTGFLSDGEFYDSRCYGYTGVLTLFY